MVDGVKVKCLGVDAIEWEKNSLLTFKSGIDIQTGEIMENGKRIAIFQGLQFHLIPSTVSDTTHCYIKGSLAKYYTQGQTNAFDFTASMLGNVLNDLWEKFGIDPAKAILERIEIGVNIIPPIEAKKIFKGLIAYKNNAFKAFSVANTTLGQCIGMPNYQTIKIYNKAKQDPKAPANMIRIEIAFMRMSPLKNYGIKTLSNLTAPKVAPLLGKLLQVWNDCIYTDGNRNYKGMSKFERSKWLFYINPKKWEDLGKKQRYRMKKHFALLNTKYGMGNTQQETAKLIAEKVKELTAETLEKSVHLLHDFSKPKGSQKLKPKCPPFTHLDEGVKRGQKETQKPKEKAYQKKCQKCIVCKVNISSLKAGAKYCSKHCSNSFHASNRTALRRARIEKEKEQLQKLLRAIEAKEYWCLISYQMGNDSFAVVLHQNEINISKAEKIKVYRVEVSTSSEFTKAITLTSYRARKIIKSINQLNFTNYENQNE
tara:strand:- start:41257 stop:42705 length:1449 start_codon:yes stop_codon:yes gene_type:complete